MQVQKVRLLLRERGLGAVRVGTVDDYQVGRGAQHTQWLWLKNTPRARVWHMIKPMQVGMMCITVGYECVNVGVCARRSLYQQGPASTLHVGCNAFPELSLTGCRGPPPCKECSLSIPHPQHQHPHHWWKVAHSYHMAARCVTMPCSVACHMLIVTRPAVAAGVYHHGTYMRSQSQKLHLFSVILPT